MTLAKTIAKMSSGFVGLLLACAALPIGAAARPASQAPTVTRVSTLVTPTDFSASRHRAHHLRHATRVHVYRRGDYSLFEPYAPPVPLFFPFGYRQGYF
jgi:hypothetical protein